ncbi:MAG: NADPH quinone oxidoreductase [Solirubrobacterales bacterium 70-9]|nr:MAG: NADPH quinone oxidoreductase [Solirubrobacterales bacterium 70-9]
MRVAEIKDKVVAPGTREDPAPGLGQALIRVQAAGVNGADPVQVAGFYPPPPEAGVAADIPGMELAGEVVESRAPVPRFEPGARVMAIVAGAAQAELAVIDERQLMPVPDLLDWTQAGGFPEVFATAYDALVGQANLRSGQRLLINGAGGGVGTAAVQLGHVLGADVTASVRTEKNRAAVEELGADRALAPDEAFAHGPFDVILELVGGPNLVENVKALAPWGTIVVIGVSAGFEGTLDLRRLMTKRGTVRASTLRYRTPEEKAILARELEASVLPLVADGRLRVPIEAEFPLDEVGAAYQRFTAGGHLGKIVIRP